MGIAYQCERLLHHVDCISGLYTIFGFVLATVLTSSLVVACLRHCKQAAPAANSFLGQLDISADALDQMFEKVAIENRNSSRRRENKISSIAANSRKWWSSATWQQQFALPIGPLVREILSNAKITNS